MVQEKAGRYARPTHTEWLSLTHRYRQSQLRRLALIELNRLLDAEPVDAAESVARDFKKVAQRTYFWIFINGINAASVANSPLADSMLAGGMTLSL
jgi:hypothetical protein